MSNFDYNVAIIGSGPSGIAAATALERAGVENIVVFDRESDIGGIPRHTHHPSFGLLVFKRPMSGPKFIKALVKRCPNVRFETNTTLTAIRPDGEFDIATPTGIRNVRARHIILATGARETPRHPRLVSGLRPKGVITTGALQQFIYTSKTRPFKRPVIIGTELVSFSAMWTLRHMGIKPVAMLERNQRITAYRPAALFARVLGVPIHLDTSLTDIGGQGRVERVTVQSSKAGTQEISCDGVIFTGDFTGENTIARASHLALSADTQLPLVDQNWLSSDPKISIIGNTTHPADMGDQCYIEGLQVGQYVAKLLEGSAVVSDSYQTITHSENIKMTTPNMVRMPTTGINVSLHVTGPYSGKVRVHVDGDSIYATTKRCMPARRITLKNVQIPPKQNGVKSEINISLGRPH
jgi:thioredoxin reductase